MRPIEWINPRQKIWGFHVHQELPFADFAKALVIQEQCAHFFRAQHIPIDADEALAPGYGPHLNYLWELRVESANSEVLEKMGLAIAFMAVNRCGLSAYLHPLMHDPSLPEIAALAAEGRESQANTVWFTHKVAQNRDFFFHPPLDTNQKIMDTRSCRILINTEIEHLIDRGNQQLAKTPFFDPFQLIVNGFHIHVDFTPEKQPLAELVFAAFMAFLNQEQLIPSSTRWYAEGENGPHLQRGFEVKFTTNDRNMLARIGIAIGWLMCNRQGLAIFMHPVTWEEGDHTEELYAHQHYSFFIDAMPPLNLGFFSDKIAASSYAIDC